MGDVIHKDEILNYGYYEDDKKYVAVINRQKLKELFKADKVIFEEIYDTRIDNID